MHTIDLIILIAYFAVVFGIGAYFFRRAKTSQSYFLADRSVGWVAIGASLFASNISSEHFIGLAGSGASSGLAVGSFEWLAVFMGIILAWVFVLGRRAHLAGVTGDLRSDLRGDEPPTYLALAEVALSTISAAR